MRIILFILLLFQFAIAKQGQSQTVRIVVIDIVSSMPIKNVNIRGKEFFAKTDERGYFVLNRSDIDSLTFTHVNYKTVITSLDRVLRNQNVAMTSKENILETVIVNTGYQKIDQRITSGAIDKIDLSRSQDVYGNNIFQKLKGNSPILFDNSDSKRSMTIRGLSSINNSNLPLIVLDNFPYEGNLDWINPEDIEDVTVLKDAAASAIWGSRAGNGVIVITTKKGKYNMSNKITLSSAVQVQERPDLNYPNQISSSGVIELETFLFEKGLYDRENTFTMPWRSPVIEHLRAIRDGIGNTVEHQQAIEDYKKLDVRKDYSKYMYRTSINQYHNLGIEGGSKNLRYQLSARIDNNIGTLDERQKKSLIRSFIEFELHPNIKLSTDLQYVDNKLKDGRTAYNPLGSRPYLMLADNNKNPIRHADYKVEYLDTVGHGLLKDWFKYPLTEYQKRHSSINSNMLLANITADVKLLKGLSFQSKYSYQFVSSKNKRNYEEDSYFVRNLINTYSIIDYSKNTVKSAIPNGGILNQSDLVEKTHNFRFGINYEKKWRDFLVTAVLGTEWRQTSSENSEYRYYGFNPDSYVTSKVDYINPYAHFIHKGAIYVPYEDSKGLKINRFLSQYANASISYRGKYVLTGSLRRDASNLFGVKTNERWQPLWSTGYKWNLSDEVFFDIDNIDLLSFRGSYGVSGNVDQTRSAITTIRYMGTDRYTNLPRAIILQFSNPNLRWEKNTIWNMGIDFSLFLGKLIGSLDYYKKWGNDLFGNAPVDYTAIPSKGIMRNIASMQGEGIDIRLNGNIPLNKRISFTPQFMLNINNSKVTDYYRIGDYAYQFLSYGTSVNGLVGYPVYSILTYKWNGLDSEGNPMGELNGERSTDYKNIRLQDKSTLEYKGTVIPRYSGYLNPGLSIGNFDFIMSFLYKFGHMFMRNTARYSELAAVSGLGNGSGDYDRRWKESGDEFKTDIPSFIYPIDSERNSFYSGSSVLVENASHIRLQNISIGYKISFRQKISGRLFCNATDLGIVWKKNRKSIDPDYYSQWKPQKLISMGIRLTY